MSIHEKINLLQSTSSCFSNMSTRYSQPKIKDIRSFHDTIRDTKDHIFNLYEKEPSYKEIMPIISKSNRGNVYYNKFVKINLKNDQRKSAFFQGLMKAIKQIQKEKAKEEDAKREKPKFKHYYIIPKIDILRKKRENFESYYNKKTKTFDNDIKILKKSNSMLNQLKLGNKEESENTFFKSVNNFQLNNINNYTNTTNINDGIFSLESFPTFNQNNEGSSQNNLKELSNFNLTKLSLVAQPKRSFQSVSKRLTRKSIDLSEYFQKQEKFIYQKNKRMNKILNKCEENLNHARTATEEIKKCAKKKDSYDILNKFKIAMQSDDQKAIEQMERGNKQYEEYKKIQEEKFNNLKKNMDLKLSNEYAYMIRKELQDTFGVNGTILAYQLYSNDMAKTKQKIEKNLEDEKRTIQKINEIMDDTIRKKEYLKYKIDCYTMKHSKLNEVKNQKLKKKGEYDNKEEYKKEELKGTLLPKLIEIRDQCYQVIDYDFNKV